MVQKLTVLVYTVLIPLFYLGAILFIVYQERNYGFGSLAVASIGIIILVQGLLLWIVALFALGRNLTVYPEGRQLVTGGVYRIFKHPCYVGINLTALGMSILCGSVLGLLITFLLVFPLNYIRARAEELILQETFGEAYTRYKSTVILPF